MATSDPYVCFQTADLACMATHERAEQVILSARLAEVAAMGRYIPGGRIG